MIRIYVRKWCLLNRTLDSLNKKVKKKKKKWNPRVYKLHLVGPLN